MTEFDIRNPQTFQGPHAPTPADLATCVHCGLCLNSCPTFRITGLETESPRGRIDLMTRWQRGELPFTDGLARHIDLCLGCRTCEGVCPSGVPYGRIIEGARAEVERLRTPRARGLAPAWGLRHILPRPSLVRAAGALTRAAQRAGLTRAVPAARLLPALEPPWRPPPDGLAPAIGPRRHRVAFLTGCVMPLMYPAAHRASVHLLQLAGCDVWFPADQACCGALHAHNGDPDTAAGLRARNQRSFGMEGFDALVVNSAGCGAHLKDSYPTLGPRVADMFEFLARAGLPDPRFEVPHRVAYQDACHLVHAQGIRDQPRALLRSLPGLTLVELPNPDICCGAAGLYNVLEPAMSAAIGDARVDDILAAAPDIVASANPGCMMQIQAGLRRRGSEIGVRHLAEVILLGWAPEPEATRSASHPAPRGEAAPPPV